MTTQKKTGMSLPSLTIILRVVLAVVGGYAASTAISLLFAGALEMTGRQEIAFVRMMFFLIYTLFIIWIFAINDQRNTLLVTLSTNAIAWTLVWSGAFL